MKPYDWCDLRCPNPCSCQAAIEEAFESERRTTGTAEPSVQDTSRAVVLPPGEERNE